MLPVLMDIRELDSASPNVDEIAGYAKARRSRIKPACAKVYTT